MTGWIRTDNHRTRRIAQGRMRFLRTSRPWLTALVSLALLLGLMVGPIAVSAAPTARFVTPTGDDNFGGALANTCADAAHPCKTIQQAVTKSSTTESDTITVAAGTYPEQVTIDRSLTLTGAGAATTKIAPPASPQPNTPLGAGSIALVSIGNSATVGMSGFTLAGPIACAFNNYGIFVFHDATLNLSATTVQDITDNNTCGSTLGIGIEIGASNSVIPPADKVGHATLDGVTVTRYKARGVIVDGLGSTATIKNGTIQDGAIPTISVAAITVFDGATATIDHNTIADHCTVTCGTTNIGIRGVGSGNLTITGNAISGNGFGISITGATGSFATIASNLLTANNPVGMAFETVNASVARNSIAGPGFTGIAMISGTLDLVNSTISGYQGGGSSGLNISGGATTVTNVTIANSSKGVVQTAGTVTLKNTLLANNGSTNCSGAIGDGGNNFDSGTSCTSFTNPSDVKNQDPRIAPLADNGDTASPHTLSHALTAGSPAIDAGGTGSGCLAIDQLGTSRPQGAACDIGAAETKVTPAVTLTGIAVTPANPSIAAGATQQFAATGVFSDSHTADLTASVTWSSTATGVATITSAGLATGVAAGSTTIKATSGTTSGTTTLTVTAAAAKASLAVDRTRVPFDEDAVILTFNATAPVESVCISANGAPAQQITKTGSGVASLTVHFIQSGTYLFTLNLSTSDCKGNTDPNVAPITVVKLTPDNTTNASITATPSTLPVVSGVVKPTTTIKFGSGTGASALVCLSVNGGTQQLYSFATFNTQTVDWTQSGTYAFRLYTSLPAGTNCATQVASSAAASVTVTAQAGLVVNPTTKSGGSAAGGATVQVTGNSGSGAPVLACVAVPSGQSQPIVLGNSGILNGPLSQLGVGSFVVTLYQSADGTTAITSVAAGAGQCTANTPLKVVPGVAPVTVTVTA